MGAGWGLRGSASSETTLLLENSARSWDSAALSWSADQVAGAISGEARATSALRSIALTAASTDDLGKWAAEPARAQLGWMVEGSRSETGAASQHSQRVFEGGGEDRDAEGVG